MIRVPSCRPRNPFSDILAMIKYPETQHVQTYIDRLVCESFNHPGLRNKEAPILCPTSLIPHPSSLCSAMLSGECWGKEQMHRSK